MLFLHLTQRKKWMFLYAALLFVAATFVTPVLADYLGPNRVVTQPGGSCQVILNKCMFVAAKGDYRYHQVDSWSCASESKPWQAYPDNRRACNPGNSGYQYWSREEGQPETVTFPPATITGSLQNCTLQNGWCVTAPQLALSGAEPVSGYSILALEGTLNGQTFACPGSSCSVALGEGDNSFTYWAISSWGDSSTMGSLSTQVDTVSPDVGLDISGSSGANSWFVSPVTLTATGSDSVSGLAGASLSVDGGPWQSITTLNDGVYNVAVTASDFAGNVSNSATTISVDTTTPALNVSITGTAGKNGWYRSSTEVSAVASDATSGIGSFEASSNGAAYQNYDFPISFADGSHTIQFRAVDNAGNITETLVQEINVDTLAPLIELPASWELGRKVSYSVQDMGSGLASLRIVIEDEDERFAKVAWEETVSGASYSEHVNWNGIFKDKTVAPPGTYLVWLKASDVAGNERVRLGKVIVPEPNLVANFFQPSPPSAETPLPPNELLEAEEPVLSVNPPTLDFGGSTTEPKETGTHSLFLTAGTAASIPASSSNVLWGAAAAATIGAATAYALEERRRREEAAIEQAIQQAKEEERRAKKRAQKMQKLEAQWAQEKAWEEARQQIDQARQQAEDRRADNKEVVLDAQTKFYSAEPQEWKPSYDAYMAQRALERQGELMADYNAMRQDLEAIGTETNWWETTKSFLGENLIQPFIKPALQGAGQLIGAGIDWVNENLYQPYLKPDIEKRKQALVNEIEWIDETIYQPILKPDIERRKQSLVNEIGWVNEKIYQPYLQNVYQPFIEPAMEKLAAKVTEGLTWVNDNIYQPALKPIVEAAREGISDAAAWANGNIYQPLIEPVVRAIDQKVYQPYIEPVVSDINKYVFQPYVMPVLDEALTWGKNTWDQDGEWVHTALDVIGVVPVVGDWADGINAGIYLAEGRYLEASVSALSMIPLLGDLGKAGKIGLKAGEEALEEVAQVAVKEGVEELLEKAGKATAEEISEKIGKEAVQEIAGQLAQESMEEVAERAAKEAGEVLLEKSTLARIGEGALEQIEEGIHTTMDLVGRIPGFGEVSSVTNGLIYLTRGKFFDASVSVMSMVPIVGNAGVAGLQGLKLAKEFLEQTVREVGEEVAGKLFKESLEMTEQVAQEVGEELLEKATKETVAEVVEDGVKEAGESLVEKTTKEAVEEAFEHGAKEASEELIEKTTKETLEAAAQKTEKEVGEELAAGISQTTAEKTAKEAESELSSGLAEEIAPAKPNKNLSTRATEDAIVDDVIQRNEDTTQPVNSLREKYGDKVLDVTQVYGDKGAALIHQYGEDSFEFVKRAEKLGVDPTDILENPPLPGQTLEGWLLRIEDPASPVNQPRGNLNLTDAERDNILKQSIVRPDSKIVVLGYGGGVEKPYYSLSDEIEGCHLSLSAEDWAPFENARSNFWTDINAPFIENAIEQRKMFLFNVDKNVITKPRNAERFSLPELRLIDLEKNNYVQVPVKDYTAYVPIELLDSFDQYLHPSLID